LKEKYEGALYSRVDELMFSDDGSRVHFFVQDGSVKREEVQRVPE
jgi:hypothetical protein